VAPQLRNCPALLQQHLPQTFQHFVQIQSLLFQLGAVLDISTTVLDYRKWSICLIEGGWLYGQAIELHLQSDATSRLDGRLALLSISAIHSQRLLIERRFDMVDDLFGRFRLDDGLHSRTCYKRND